MKHDNTHKIDFACLDCVFKHIEHKNRLIDFVRKIQEGLFNPYFLIIDAKELLESIESDNETN